MQVRRLADDEVDAVLAAGLDLSRLDGDTLRSTTGFYLVAWDAWDDGARSAASSGTASTPLGHAHLALTDPPELQDVLVVPAARGRGVARALVEAASGEARARGATVLRLDVGEGNDAARAVYARLGFTDAGLPLRHVSGTIRIRSGPIEVDDILLSLERPL